MALTEAEIGKLVAKEVREIVANSKLETPIKEVSEEILQRFEENLAVKVEQELAKRQEVDLIVDELSDPEDLLERAAIEAGLPCQNFPGELWVRVTRDVVEVQKGYKGEKKLLYSRKPYWQQRLLEVKGDIHNLQETLEGKNPFRWGGPDEVEEIREMNERLCGMQESQKKIEAAFSVAEA